MTKQTFMKGTLILILAGLIVKILGFINRVMLARIIGAEGLGLYQMAVPTFILIISLATFGLNVSVSKLVAEADARGDHEQVRSILRISLLIVSALSILFTTVMLLSAPVISRYFLTDERAFYPLLAIAPIVPIIAVSSVLRGYFQGKQNMTPTASSQLVEQVIRMFTVIILASWLMPHGVEYAAAGAMAGVVIGEAFGMISLLFQFRSQKLPNPFKQRSISGLLKQNRETFRNLLDISIPVTTSRIVSSLTFFVEPIIVAQSLLLAGMSAGAATSFYGQLAGMAMPLLIFPTFITYSLSVSLVPAVAEAAAQKNDKLIYRRIYQSIRLALIIGAPCAVLLYIFAEPLSTLLYNDEAVGHFLKLMAPYSLFLYFQAPLQAALQGLDRAGVAMRNTIIGALLKTAAIFLLASRPELGVDGVVLSVNISILSVTLLHFFSVSKVTGFTIEIKEMVKVLISVALSGYTALHMTRYWSHLMELPQAMLLGICLALFIYSLLLIWLRVLGKQDVQRIPWIGPTLAHFLPRR
ncbi:stage V sporulation protein B [Aneurinibacillus migulanus]|uniref:Stage V sporulation protein B n=1 Tax=Aneurinibacillus migulanus TaxID=47500 RepID=A0A0D1W3K0_ANEMI|nr:stage V sporulation protein B [Aneurinibacillus migulanus]KIV52945.1 stage V sporulation protein B [Aneurinibacillus migulanus]KON98387.1 stage V sporulation protein B [Aneurinibacillus migulanus]MED0895820.1 stage V sporulation protein B [Aneurinibacillus migulanus]MED1614828.1 stage V sporulation protein B [Aneurinibacillus migulanus]SDJ39493.1 stage V sporulation protein B [Aneurinibacillus migulanus]